MTTFFSYKALVSQRSSGYRSTTYALAEIIDNAFDAEAKSCRIIFIESRDENGRKYTDEVLIADDGYGMTSADLEACLQFGGGVNKDLDEIIREKKKGKFGYGLPNASLSQCPCVHVFSRQDNNGYKSIYLDLAELESEESIEIPPVKDVSLPPYYEQVGAVINKKGGVIVSWRRCDRLMNSKAGTIVEKSEELLGKLFRYLVGEGKQITLLVYEKGGHSGSYTKTLEKAVRPNDPLFLQSDTVISKVLDKLSQTGPGISEQDAKIAAHYSKYSKGKKKCAPTNDKVEDQCYVYRFEWRGRSYKFPITTSVAKGDMQKPGIRDGGSTKVGAFYARKDSICFVRADREIASGRFGSGFYKATEPRNRWWTIEIKFDADADDLLGVHNNKQGIEFTYTKEFDPSEEWNPHTSTLQQARDRLWYELTNKILLAKKEAWKLVLKAHRDWDLSHKGKDDGDEGGGIPQGTSRAQEVSGNVDGKRKSQFSREEREALGKRLKEKYPALSEEDIQISVDRFDRQMSRGCVLYHESDSQALWSLTTVYDFLIVLINTEHEFYKSVLSPLRRLGAEAALAAIELFISSLALEEKEHFSQDKYKDTIELFRSYVGIHLNRYLKDLNLSENELLFADENSEEIEEDEEEKVL